MTSPMRKTMMLETDMITEVCGTAAPGEDIGDQKPDGHEQEDPAHGQEDLQGLEERRQANHEQQGLQAVADLGHGAGADSLLDLDGHPLHGTAAFQHCEGARGREGESRGHEVEVAEDHVAFERAKPELTSGIWTPARKLAKAERTNFPGRRTMRLDRSRAIAFRRPCRGDRSHRTSRWTSSGSCCPSPSKQTTMSPRACRQPVRRLAPYPLFHS